MKKPQLVLLAIGLLLGADTPKDYDDTVTSNDLVGAWKLVAAERNGVAFGSVGGGKSVIVTYRGGRYTTTTTDGKMVDEGTYVVDGGQRPMTLGETSSTAPQKGRIFRYLYQVNGDTLRLAYFDDCSVRPRSFDEQDISIITFKREKK